MQIHSPSQSSQNLAHLHNMLNLKLLQARLWLNLHVKIPFPSFRALHNSHPQNSEDDEKAGPHAHLFLMWECLANFSLLVSRRVAALQCDTTPRDEQDDIKLHLDGMGC